MSSGEYDGLSATFAKACRAADEHARKQPRNPILERLRVLLDENKVPTIEAAYAAFEAERRKHGAAPSTVEALMWSLREHGTAALAQPDTLRRLGALSRTQVRGVIARLMALRSQYPAITDDLLFRLGEQIS